MIFPSWLATCVIYDEDDEKQAEEDDEPESPEDREVSDVFSRKFSLRLCRRFEVLSAEKSDVKRKKMTLKNGFLN